MKTRTSNSAPLTLALAGCGRISQVHLQAIARESRVRLVAVADTDPTVGRSVAAAFNVPAFWDLKSLIASVAPDAVILCTPPDTHRELAEMALGAGVHVLCEKPLTLSAADANAMIERAGSTERTLMMASKFRYVQDIIYAKGMIESGILGEVVLYENDFCSHVDMKNRWNAIRGIAGGGVLIDNGSHSVDIFRYLIGPVVGLQATTGKNWQDLEVEDSCHLLLRSADNIIGSIGLSWSIHKEDPFFIHIYGTEGMLQVGWKQSRYRQSEKMEWVAFGSGYDKFSAVGAQLSNFIGVVREHEEPVITSEDALESVRVIQSAYHTISESHWESIAK